MATGGKENVWDAWLHVCNGLHQQRKISSLTFGERLKYVEIHQSPTHDVRQVRASGH